MIWGSATHHRREMRPLEQARGRQRCLDCKRIDPSSTRKCTHMGTANGVALMVGCELHVRAWVRQGRVR